MAAMSASCSASFRLQLGLHDAYNCLLLDCACVQVKHLRKLANSSWRSRGPREWQAGIELTCPVACAVLDLWHVLCCCRRCCYLLQVPEHIQRPDYAVTGVPTSEVESKQQRAGAPADALVAAGAQRPITAAAGGCCTSHAVGVQWAVLELQ
jgi:hypothetical protein